VKVDESGSQLDFGGRQKWSRSTRDKAGGNFDTRLVLKDCHSPLVPRPTEPSCSLELMHGLIPIEWFCTCLYFPISRKMSPPEYQQATGLARREAVAKPTASGAEREAAKGPPERGNAGGLNGPQIPTAAAPAAAIDFAEATPVETPVVANATAFDSNQQISAAAEATTSDAAECDNAEDGSGLQSSESLQRARAESDGRTAVLFGQGGRFASGEEAETSRASRISDADLGALTPKASLQLTRA